MKALSFLQYIRLTMFSHPVCDRAIYKLIKKHSFRSFIELGMEDGNRSQWMIRVAAKYGASKNVRYTGVDQFDDRGDDQEKLQLIDVHRRLQSANAKTQLVPGDLQLAISRIANSHVRTDLIVISAGYDQAALDTSWFYFPRMLHSGSLVLIQHEVGREFKAMNRLEIEKLAEKQTRKRGMAA